MAKLASKVYGDALFDLAVEEQKVEQLKEEAALVKEALLDNPELSGLMRHPKIIREEKAGLIENCFKGRVSEEMVGFLVVVVNKGRYQELPAIFDYFLARVKEHQGIGTASVISAVELSDTWKARVKEKLLATTKYHTMEISYQVDAGLIGGLIIRIGDRVVDSSLKHKLDELTGQLMKISLELEKEGGQAS